MRTQRHVRIDRLVPATGDLADLVAEVARRRGRPVHLLPASLGPDAPSGMWVSTDRADYVVFPDEATPARRTSVVCHELAHMLLEHEPQDGAQTALAAAAAPTIDSAVAARMLMRHAYASRQERDAELLGTRLAAALADEERRAVRASDRLDDRLQ
jgi:hypothetical protein